MFTRHLSFLAATTIALLLVLSLGSIDARADQITVGGTTSGTFSLTGKNTLGNLAYTSAGNGTGFSATTSGGLATVSLGSFSFGSVTKAIDPVGLLGSFMLNVMFDLPTGIFENGSSEFTYSVLGSVTGFIEGAAILDFTDYSEVVDFSNGTSKGSFTLTLPSVIVVLPGSTTALNGSISGVATAVTTAATPEPPVWLLSLVGISLAFAAKRLAIG